MNRYRVAFLVPSSLRHGASTTRTLSADPMQRACAGEEGVAGDGVGPSPSSPVDTSFYRDLDPQQLHAELVRLGAVLQNRGVTA